MKLTKRRIGVLAIALVAVAIAVYALVPRPLPVEVATVTRGSLTVTVEEDGMTRVRERYELTAPVAGKLRRIEVHAGDVVAASQPLVVLDPAPLDPKQQAQLQSRIDAADRTWRQTDALLTRARNARELMRRDQQRLRRLFAEGVVSREALDQAVTAAAVAEKDVDAARFRAEAAHYELELARNALHAADPSTGAPRMLSLRSPIAGRVLRVHQESEAVVVAGARIIDLGDPATMEAVADLLSTDAVRVKPGQRVIIDDWGGARPLEGRVRLVEPSGFTKISALGVEEQRVNVLADFAERPQNLGDQYRITARIVVWEGEAVRVPTTAIFSSGPGWAAFRLDDGRARQVPVRIGHIATTHAEVLGGLSEGDRVIVHPSDQVRDGVAVKAGLFGPRPSALGLRRTLLGTLRGPKAEGRGPIRMVRS